MHYYLYQITNKVNGKIYVGVHKTQKLDDGYMGSGKVIRSAILKYGPDNFEKEILEHFDSAEAMFAREKEVVTEEFLARSDVYNLRRGGTGGFDYINSNEETRIAKNQKARAITDRVMFERYGESWRSKIAKKGSVNSLKSPNRKYGFRDNIKGRETCNTPEARKRAAETYKRTAAIRGTHQGSRNSQFGSFWITDGTSNKKCRDEIPAGWIRGRIP